MPATERVLPPTAPVLTPTVPVLTPTVPVQAVGVSVLRPPIDLTSDEPASGGNQPAPGGGNDRPGLPWQDPQTALSGWHRGALFVDTDSVLAVPQSVHEPARGVATDSRVHYTLASGGTEPASGGQSEAAATRPASPQPLASGNTCGSFEEVALPTTSDIVDVQAEVDAEAAGEEAATSSAANSKPPGWPWPMDRKIGQ